MVKAIMHGCNGKMGQVITGLIKADEAIEIVAGIDTYTGITNDYPVFESIEKCDVKADVIIPTLRQRIGFWTFAQTGRSRLFFAPPDYQRSSWRR